MENNSNNLLKNLNPQQEEAVRHYEGPLLIFAGAGSGKTRVITRRIAHLIAERGVPPSQILGLTFTNKAASEMSDRVEVLLPPSQGLASPWLGTFHSLGAEFLRNYIDLWDGNRTRSFTIYDQSDQKAVLTRVISDLDMDTEEYSPGMVAAIISDAKNDLIGPGDFRSARAGQYEDYFLKQVSRLYQAYQEELAGCNAVDFGDLIYIPTKVLQSSDEAADRWRSQFRFILVDEYQDTNHAQYVFSRLLAEDHDNICVVGDDDQAIFGWRGANVENILNFESDFPDARVIRLSRNYRSTRPILRVARSLISHNQERQEKQIQADRGEGEKVQIYSAQDETDEADYVVRKIKSLHRQGVPLEDIAIFYRVNTLSRVLEERLVRQNVNYEVIKGTRFYERKEIKDVLAYLRLVCNPEDDVSLLRVINTPRRGIGSKTEEKIRDHADNHGISVWEALQDLGSADGALSSRQSTKVQEFQNLIRKFMEWEEDLEPRDFVEQILSEIDYTSYLDKSFNSQSADQRKDNIHELLGQIEEVVEGEDLRDFLEVVALDSDISRFEGEQDAVSLLTLHSAKGLEFDYVFIVGFEEGLLPHQNSMDEGRLEEERRLCYVGLTRAKDKLFLSHAKQRFLYGRRVNNQPSRFLEEMPEGDLSFSSSGTGGGRTEGVTLSQKGSDWREFLD